MNNIFDTKALQKQLNKINNQPMGLVINFPVQQEDRFNIALRDRNSRVTFPHSEWKGEDVGEQYNNSDTKGINLYFELRQKEYNGFFHWLSDIETIMGMKFKFRYVNTKREAYTGHDGHNMFNHLWLTIK